MRISINNGRNMKYLVYSVHAVLGGFDDLTPKTETIMYLCGTYQTLYNIIIIYFTSITSVENKD